MLRSHLLRLSFVLAASVAATACSKPLPAAPAHPHASKDWCQTHAVPESMCTKCDPSLIARFIEAGDYCREHGYPASVCPIHHPELVKAAGGTAPQFPAEGTQVRLASSRTAQVAGLQTIRVEKRPFAHTLDVVGQLTFDQNQLAQLSARGEAQVLEVRVDVGDEVQAGQPVARLGSAAVGSGQAQIAALEARLKAARLAVTREEALVQRGVSPRKNLEAAQAASAAAAGDFDAARAVLAAAGASATGTGGQVLLTAPFAGTVVARDAVIGRSVAAGQVLLEVADLSTMWAQLDLPEAEAGLVRPGQRVLLEWEGATAEAREATITRVGASVDPMTRSVRARVEVPNPSRALKAGSFLRAKVFVEGAHDALMVPRQAVQRAEGRTLVFVMDSPTVFTPRVVVLGAGSPDWVEVRSGLEPGTSVVTTGAFLLKTEILKESIGAGCCDEGGR